MLIGVSSLIRICFPFQLAISLFTSQSHLGRVAINERPYRLAWTIPPQCHFIAKLCVAVGHQFDHANEISRCRSSLFLSSANEPFSGFEAN